MDGVAGEEHVYTCLLGSAAAVCEQCVGGRDNMYRSYGLIGAMCHGGYAEYVKVPENVHPIPASVL